MDGMLAAFESAIEDHASSSTVEARGLRLPVTGTLDENTFGGPRFHRADTPFVALEFGTGTGVVDSIVELNSQGSGQRGGTISSMSSETDSNNELRVRLLARRYARGVLTREEQARLEIVSSRQTARRPMVTLAEQERVTAMTIELDQAARSRDIIAKKYGL